MSLRLKDLNSVTRQYMIDEINLDIEKDNVLLSKHLTSLGKLEWTRLLFEALSKYDSDFLEAQLAPALYEVSILVKNRNGKWQKHTAEPMYLADAEFNRYYMRAICIDAIEREFTHVVSYRARDAKKPISLPGEIFDPHEVLDDLRNNKETTRTGVLSNPYSGMSIMVLE